MMAGPGRSATGRTLQRRRGRAIALILGLIVAGTLVNAVVHGVSNDLSGSAYTGPRCRPHAADCRRSSDGYWIPVWYYRSLQQAQSNADVGGSAGTGDVGVGVIPSVRGAQPTVNEEEADGATEDQADSAQSASDSDDSASAGAGSGGGDDGDDDGGGGGGGGGGGDDD